MYQELQKVVFTENLHRATEGQLGNEKGEFKVESAHGSQIISSSHSHVCCVITVSELERWY